MVFAVCILRTSNLFSYVKAQGATPREHIDGIYQINGLPEANIFFEKTPARKGTSLYYKHFFIIVFQ